MAQSLPTWRSPSARMHEPLPKVVRLPGGWQREALATPDEAGPLAVTQELASEASANPPRQMTGLRRAVYVMAGCGFLALGILGAFLPGLPTTPFLLLTSFFLVRSSPALHARVMRLPVVGRFLNDWREKGGIRPRVKVLATATVLAVVGLSLAVSIAPLIFKVVISGLAVIGLTVIWRLPTLRD